MKGISVTALILSALAVPAFAQNLVVNGGFEAGSTGWTTWRAPWGSGETYDFNNTQAGHLGTKCLRISTNGQGSFGVYQQVSVTPGKAYRIDAYWKGQRFGASNWCEILLIDGPFSMAQADDGGEQVVRPNYMYAYDINTYPLTADFGWVWAHDQNGVAGLDYNNRNGERTATGNTMTVVLKGGACCDTNGVSMWFDDVSLVEVGASQGGASCGIANGAFSDGLTGWSNWTQNGSPSISVNAGELTISGNNFNGGVYQQFGTGGAGKVVTITGAWRSTPTLSNTMWAEVLVINGNRTPVNGVDETDGNNNTLLLFKNDTFNGRGAWDGALAKNAPVKNTVSFVATGPTATLILKTGNTGAGTTGVKFDNLEVRCIPAPATLNSLPTGFARRTYTFPIHHMVSLAQSPTSRNIYAVSNAPGGQPGAVRLYRVNVDGGGITTTQINGLNLDEAQGMTFDPAGNMYISNRIGKIVKGTDTNADPAIDSFSFAQILALNEPNIGTFHGVGGVAVGPDGKLYINSGSDTHYGPEPDKGQNMRILRCNLDGSNVETFCYGIRNSFDISFRADGKLFGVENGPNTNCDYAEEFNLLEAGQHYGFPYRFASDLNGSNNSITCTSDGSNVGPQPLPGGLVVRPAWANYGPDGKPGPGQVGEQDNLADVYWGFHPHSSPDGLDFYEPALMDTSSAAIKFPPEYHGRAFVARFGILENVPTAGFDVLTLRLDEPYEGFVSNTFLSGLGRAIDVLCAYNGKVYILEFNQQTCFTGNCGSWTSSSRLHEISYTIPPDQPQIQLDPMSLTRTVDLGQSLSDDVFTVTNSGGETLEYSISDDAGWLSVSPTGGSSTGESDEITVSYDVDGLSCGTYNATIVVSDPNSVNDPQAISVSVTVRSVLPDFDCDGDVDQADFGYFQKCFSTAGGLAPPAGCGDADLDGDVDVDQADLVIFRGCQSGENVPANPACDDNWD
ncbi:MAG: hypothetical protein AMXMBFR13_44930 [Phycisphaerae bacterium]